jgi:hypothetical protein
MATAQSAGDARSAPGIRPRSAHKKVLWTSGFGDLRPARGPDPQRLCGRSENPGRRAVCLRSVQLAVSSRPRTRLPAGLRRRVSRHGSLRTRPSAAPAGSWQGEDDADHSDTELDLHADTDSGSVLYGLAFRVLSPRVEPRSPSFRVRARSRHLRTGALWIGPFLIPLCSGALSAGPGVLQLPGLSGATR